MDSLFRAAKLSNFNIKTTIYSYTLTILYIHLASIMYSIYLPVTVKCTSCLMINK